MNSTSLNPSHNYFGVSIDKEHLYDNFLKRSSGRNSLAVASLATSDYKSESPKGKKYNDVICTLGFINTAAQAVSGAILTGLAISVGKKGWKPTENTSKIYTGGKQKVYQLAMGILSAGYFVGVPSVLGAGIKSEQPGMVTTGVLDGVLAGLLLNKKFNNSTHFHGLKNFNYASSYAGFANKTDNEFGKENDQGMRKMNMGFLLQKNAYLKLFSSDEEGAKARKNMAGLVKFVAMDIVYAFKNAGLGIKKAVKQTGDWIGGKRKERPDIFTTKPSKDNMSLASVLVIAGSLPKLVLGNKLKTKVGAKLEEKFAKRLKKTVFKNVNLATMPIVATDFLIGTGMMFESLGMLNLANAKHDSRRMPVILTTPFRIIGDFMQQRPGMQGMRTAASSAYEYYVTLMNKEENGKLNEH